ncbi:gibberellin-regulated protein 1-like [Typha angustifolia]|uniref:gibberellin-regulated protein 1-like n=1 Tax=Typha angustifolia TaxID=59011 RepID=UPI003C2DBE5C
MASSSRALLTSLLLFLLLAISLVESRRVMFNTQMLMDGGSANMDCGGSCAERCKLSSRPNLCKRACGSCCKKCSCVPPGTYGNYEMCPCYAAITTRGGQRKCP